MLSWSRKAFTILVTLNTDYYSYSLRLLFPDYNSKFPILINTINISETYLL